MRPPHAIRSRMKGDYIIMRLPELKRVIAVYGEKVEMGKTHASALEKIFDINNAGISTFSLNAETTHSDTDEESIPDLARRVAKYFHAAQESIRKSYWVEYGQYQEQLEGAIRDLSAALELEEK